MHLPKKMHDDAEAPKDSPDAIGGLASGHRHDECGGQRVEHIQAHRLRLFAQIENDDECVVLVCQYPVGVSS